MLKRVFNLLILLGALFLIVLVAPSMLIVPSGENLTSSNYLYFSGALLLGIGLLFTFYLVSKRSK